MSDPLSGFPLVGNPESERAPLTFTQLLPKTFFQFVWPPLWIFLNEGLNSANVSFLNQYLISQTIVLVT